MSIYKPCDIRGRAESDLTPELYRRWGWALGRQLKPAGKFIIGGDVRASTPQFLAALADGLCRTQADVVDLGCIPTPIVYYAKRRLGAAGCAIVTASHTLADVNGLQWMLGDRLPTSNEVRALKKSAEDEAVALPDPLSKPRTLDVTFDYVAWLQETWTDWRGLPRAVIVDPMHGSWSCRARRYLQAVFPHSLFHAVHDTPNGLFDGRAPDCTRHEQLEELIEAVYRERAYLGVAFDGDGDRLALVDEDGVVLNADETAWLLLHSFGEELRGEKFVYDARFSDRLPEAAAALGAEPVRAGCGCDAIRAAMADANARFAAEVSGHFFYRELEGGDDGLFTACRIIAHLARYGHSLAELRRECPATHVTPDLRVPAAARAQQAVLRRAREVWADRPQTEIGGLRIDFPTGWALVRGSQSEPALAFRFEAREAPDMAELVLDVCNGLPEVGDALWYRYQQSLGRTDETDEADAPEKCL